MDFAYQPSLAWTMDTARREFESWIFLSALRDLAEVTTAFLASVQSIANTALLHELQTQAEHITPQEWKRIVVEGEARFDKANLPDKLRLLLTEHALDIPGGALTHIASLYRIRNCLVHRGGIVQSQDADNSGQLVASWLALNPYLVSSSGEEPLILPRDMEAGSHIVIRNELNSKFFSVGDEVIFSALEFHEIAHGFSLFGQQVVHALEGRMRAAGIAFAEGAPPSAA